MKPWYYLGVWWNPTKFAESSTDKGVRKDNDLIFKTLNFSHHFLCMETVSEE